MKCRVREKAVVAAQEFGAALPQDVVLERLLTQAELTLADRAFDSAALGRLVGIPGITARRIKEERRVTVAAARQTIAKRVTEYQRQGEVHLLQDEWTREGGNSQLGLQLACGMLRDGVVHYERFLIGQVAPMGGANAEALWHLAQEVLASYCAVACPGALAESIVSIATDTAAVNRSVARIARKTFLPCWCHVLQLANGQVLKQPLVAELCNFAAYLMALLRKSRKLWEAIRTESPDLPRPRIPNFVRWFSWKGVFEVVIRCWYELVEFFRRHDGDRVLGLKERLASLVMRKFERQNGEAAGAAELLRQARVLLPQLDCETDDGVDDGEIQVRRHITAQEEAGLTLLAVVEGGRVSLLTPQATA